MRRHVRPTRSSADVGRFAWGRHPQVRKLVILPLAIALSITVVGVAYGWITSSNTLSNLFGLGSVNAQVDETTEGLVKSNVYAKNGGTVPAFVRAQVSIYWVDESGSRLWEEPAQGTDYTATGFPGTYWTQGLDGYYYYASEVAAGGQTSTLIGAIQQSAEQRAADKAENRHLVCDITTELIQASPVTAVENAWGASVAEDGTLTPPSKAGA